MALHLLLRESRTRSDSKLEFFMPFIDYPWEDWLKVREAAVLLDKALVPCELQEGYTPPGTLTPKHRLNFNADETEVISLLKYWKCLPRKLNRRQKTRRTKNPFTFLTEDNGHERKPGSVDSPHGAT